MEASKNSNIILIQDPVEGYVAQTLTETITSIGTPAAAISSPAELTGDSIFDEPKTYTLELKEKADVDLIVARLNTGLAPEDISAGLIIHTSLPKTQTRKLANALKKYPNSITKTSDTTSSKTHATQALNKLHLSAPAKQFIIDYLGEDKENAYTVAQRLSQLSKTEQENITYEEVMMYLPAIPGVKPPWGIPDAILAGDTKQAYKIFEDTRKNAIFVTNFLKNYLVTLHAIAVTIEKNPRISDKALAETLGLKAGWAVTKKRRQARSAGSGRIKAMCGIMLQLSHDLTGGSYVPDDTLTYKALADLTSVAT
jgi:hypothetical protein